MSSAAQLDLVLDAIGEAAIAVSGGVDSLTLASFAYAGGRAPMIVHGLSPAVPVAATARVRQQAKLGGWRLSVVDAGEFGDANYRANPVNRCYFCKSNLYATIASLASGTVLSGANMDDLSDYRPGLEAARENGVRHPFIEAGMSKSNVRELARDMGLDEIADLPASPCLASRVETGIAIESATLEAIDATESWLRERLPKATIRCRYRRQGWVIELDEASLVTAQTSELVAGLRVAIPALATQALSVRPYRRGSAFLHSPQV